VIEQEIEDIKALKTKSEKEAADTKELTK